MQFYLEEIPYVRLNDFADCADSYSGWCSAKLGPQPQLGIWPKRNTGRGGGGSDCAVADGPNLTQYWLLSGLSAVQLLPDFFKPLDADWLGCAQFLGKKAHP